MSNEYKPHYGTPRADAVHESVRSMCSVLKHIKDYSSPPKDSVLEANYALSLKTYFDYTQRAFTDPDMVALIERNKAILSRKWKKQQSNDLVPLLIDEEKLTRDITGGIGDERDGEENFFVGVVLIHPKPGLIFTIYKQFPVWGVNLSGVHINRDYIDGWINKFMPQSSGWNYMKGRFHESGYTYYSEEIHGYRPMEGDDLLAMPRMVERFVEGVGDVFGELVCVAQNEEMFNVDEIKRLKRLGEIVDAFGRANQILGETLGYASNNTQKADSMPGKMQDISKTSQI